MGSINRSDLYQYYNQLKNIFNAITFEKDASRHFNNLFRQDEIRAHIRLAFHKHRELQVKSEIVPKNASLLVIEKLTPVEEHDKLYPNASDVKEIVQSDATGKDIALLQKEMEKAQRKLQEFIASQPNPDLFVMAGFNGKTPKIFSKAVISKDRTFHYLPYSFYQSRFELNFLKEIISLSSFMESNLEVYYNGEGHLTEFRIACYSKKKDRWRSIGKYTPDFLVIRRKDGNIHKILIVETKGSGYAAQPEFIARKSFMESEFLKMNNEKFGYNRFDYLYLPEDPDINKNLLLFKTRIESFFKEN
jgi:type III restriction enzyme